MDSYVALAVHCFVPNWSCSNAWPCLNKSTILLVTLDVKHTDVSAKYLHTKSSTKCINQKQKATYLRFIFVPWGQKVKDLLNVLANCYIQLYWMNAWYNYITDINVVILNRMICAKLIMFIFETMVCINYVGVFSIHWLAWTPPSDIHFCGCWCSSTEQVQTGFQPLSEQGGL